MPGRREFESQDAKRGTLGGVPRSSDRGVVSDDTALQKWAQRRGYAMDFDAAPVTPKRPAASGKAPPRKAPPRKAPAPRDVPPQRPKFRPAPVEEPPIVYQRNPNDCWAAALGAWGKAAQLKYAPTYDDLRKAYPEEARLGMGIGKLREVADAVGMDTRWFKRTDLTRERLAELRDRYGPIFVGRYHSPGLGPDWWHAVVLYDATPDGHFFVMDPARAGAFTTMRIEQLFHKNDEILIGFKAARRR
jgi:hypothetical protein